MRVAIVGAGMAGMACAELLRARGADVRLFDKGRAPGGRMSTRRIATAAGEAAFDHGAQYFTARDPGFRNRVQRWATDGHAAPWPPAGVDAWVGVPGMNAPVKEMAQQADVRWQVQIDALANAHGVWDVAGEAYDCAVVAVPAEQAAPLVQAWDGAFAACARDTPAAPCWTVMAAFGTRVRVQADVLRPAGVVGWAARNSAKPGRSGPEAWVIQAGPDWSRDNLELPAGDVVAPLLDELAKHADGPLPTPLSATAHRWRYARSGNAQRGCLWNAGLRLGVCGDWLIGPRVEAAWLSGTALAERMTIAG